MTAPRLTPWAPPARQWASRLALAAGILLPGASVAGPETAAPRPRVLVLYSDPLAMPAVTAMHSGLWKVLTLGSPTELELDAEYLALAQVEEPGFADLVTDLLMAKYRERPPRVVIAVGDPALRFLLGRRTTLFPAAGLFFCYVERRDLAGIEVPPDVAGIVSSWSIVDQVDIALRLRPETRELVVIAGTTPWEQEWLARFRVELSQNPERARVRYWSDLSMDELERRLAALPPHTAVIYFSILRDATGTRFVPALALEKLAERSSAPFYSAASTYLGRGVVGTGQVDFFRVGEQAGNAVLRMLGGESPRAVGVHDVMPGPHRFDARQLKRWGIPRERLPDGSRVEFEERGLWQEYRREILAVAGVIGSLVGLVVALLVQLKRRRNADAAIRRSEALGASILASLHERLAVLNRDGTIMSTNAAWDGAANFIVGESAGRRARGLNLLEQCEQLGQSDPTFDRLRRGVASVLAGVDGGFEIELGPSAATLERALQVTVLPLKHSEGGAVITLDDVTDRRSAEERFRVVVEASPTAFVMVDLGGTIVLVNRALERLLGHRREDLLAQSVEILIPDGLRDGHARARGGYLSRPEARPMGADRTLRAHRAGGSEVAVEIGLQPIATTSGTLILAAITGIDERLEVARLRAEIAHFGRIATLGELSAAIAHELNQPLTGILTNAYAAQCYLARGSDEVANVQEILADIQADGRRAGEVIHRLRSMLHKEPGERIPLSINQVVEQVVRLVHSDLILRGTALDLELATGLAPVGGDSVQLQQVLINLILNGVEAMAEMPVQRRRLLLRTLPNEGRTIRTEIRDSGPGVPREALARLFDPFFTTKEAGMGMGLSLVRSIVESHGGTVTAENTIAGGALFTVILPTAEARVSVS